MNRLEPGTQLSVERGAPFFPEVDLLTFRGILPPTADASELMGRAFNCLCCRRTAVGDEVRDEAGREPGPWFS